MRDMCLLLKVQGDNFDLAQRCSLVCTFIAKTKFFQSFPAQQFSWKFPIGGADEEVLMFFSSFFHLVCFTGDSNYSLVGQISALEGEEGVCGAHHVCAGIQWGTVTVHQGKS